MALEKVEKNVARFVYNNYSHYASVSEILGRLNWPTLAQGCNEQKLTMMYKIVHQLIDIQASSYLTQPLQQNTPLEIYPTIHKNSY